MCSKQRPVDITDLLPSTQDISHCKFEELKLTSTSTEQTEINNDNQQMIKTLQLEAEKEDLCKPFAANPQAHLSLLEFVQTIQEELLNKTTKDAALIKRIGELITAYDASGNEWKRYEFFDENKQYTRNLVATDHSTFTLMLLCWNKNKASPIHDHAGSECWMRVIRGSVEEHRYGFPSPVITNTENESTSAACSDEPLQLICSRSASTGEAVFINDSIGLHKVGNPSLTEDAVTLHLYAPPFDSCKCFLNGRSKSTTSFVTFYSENGEKVSYM